ncbi:MAG: ornithine cyclodeaminase family protein [Desulfobacterales bacterium]|jgi:ornithine cyclodeaminase|nr:ornithine cyclodeaminase family protein [Desulfobacterales bacterium]MDD3080604.1 ornithine cyclodeaminase family protein [Desulfobacterales bacterium]MDD3949608.1 ornithine cyclodeaminase family protein [Desulfobacterales bacterium]MDD4464910.1 ornithine cyclodeaminase family protein [Desulfobacterales bacterium]MDY0376953.1 ornithine cyclodeaminase family protein [Desulfobacterales bacterium]
MALLIREDEVRQVLTMQSAVEAVEQAMKEHALGLAVNIPRERTRIQKGALHILQGAVESCGVFGYKAYTSTREGIRFLVYLYNSLRGKLEAVIEADYLGMIRTGASGGVAARWLSRENSKTVGMFGAGWQAHGQLEALCCVRNIETARVFARNVEKLEAFCKSRSEKLGIEVIPCLSAREAVSGADIIVTITTASKPLFSHEWVEKGVHINAAGSNALIRAELDEKTLQKADIVAVDAKDVAQRECGDLLPLVEKGRIHWGRVFELGEIIAGRAPGRTRDEQITIFESQGMAIQDLAVGACVLQAAREKGLGIDLPIGA